MIDRRRPAYWGGARHVRYTVVVFVVLASLDNAAGALYPALLKVMAEDLGTTEGRLGLVTATMILITAVSAVGWGYWGDRSNRKRLLFWGTLVWAAGLVLTTTATTFGGVFAWSLLTGTGLGAIASVGFSVISDFISPVRRGLAMSFWGLSQGIGGIIGLGFGGLLGATEWRRPFVALAVIGTVVALLYLTAYDAPRGRSEPALARLFASGDGYDYTIKRADLRRLADVHTNRWLILQGLTAQIAYGSLIWVPLLYQSKVQAEGYDLATATAVGTLFGVIFQLGGITSIASGWLGDRLQRRTPKARAMISATGVLAAVPFFIVFFTIPLNGLDIPTEDGSLAVIGATVASVFTNPYVAASFVVSILALTFTSADSPNWFALITDVNLPEHRGTIFGLGNLINGFGRALGNGLTGFSADALAGSFAPPANFIVGLTAFQVFFLPTGYCYWKAAQTSSQDIERVKATLARRADGGE